MDNQNHFPAKSKHVLSDHRRIGKCLIPPMNDLNLQEVHWNKQIIPELIWLALINNYFGYSKGAELSLELPRAMEEVNTSIQNGTWCFSVSSYSQITNEEKKNIVEILYRKKVLEKFRSALMPLILNYPMCPLNFLFDVNLPKDMETTGIEKIKDVLSSMFDRRSVESTFVQANVLYIGFIIGKLVVSQDVSLAKFPEVQYYPKTELSKQVAASIRATVNSIFGIDNLETGLSWSTYFWNHGLELEKCDFDWGNTNG